ncbi:MAG: OmpP1/FadL family transporter [bacterium]
MGTRIFLNIRINSYIGLILFFCVLTRASFGFCQAVPHISITSLQPVGSGARAIGMGGAFIGIADDATAASWNPAGLIQLKRSEISFVGDVISIDHQDDQFSDKSDFAVNYFSFVYPAYLLKRNMVFSINYQNLYQMGSEGRINTTEIVQGTPWTDNNLTHYKKEGSLSAISPAVAFQVNPSLTVGVTLNIWPKRLIAQNGWEQSLYWENDLISSVPTIPDSHSFLYVEDDYKLESEINYYIGFRLKLNHMVTLGAVYKSPLTAEFTREREFDFENVLPDEFDLPKVDGELYFPESYGMGIAARINDNLTLDFDIYYTEWDKYSIEFNYMESDPNMDDPIISENGESLQSINYIRLGGEYLFIRPRYIIPFRFGIFYDPEPSQAHYKTVDWPNGCSVGTGVSFKRISMDCAVKYRKVQDNKRIKDPNLQIITTDTEELSLYFSIIYYL